MNEELTLQQIRDRRRAAEASISEILLTLTQATGLHVYDIHVRTSAVSSIDSPRRKVIGVDATIVLENP